jgi:hypothetical protein
MTEMTPAKEEDPSRSPDAGWPRWAAAVLTASGMVVIVAETTSLLFFAGLAFVGFGICGFAFGPRARRPHPVPEAPPSGIRTKEGARYGS